MATPQERRVLGLLPTQLPTASRRRLTALRRLPAIPVLLVALAFAKGLLWSLALPPWYGPDEPAHFSYVALIAVRHHIPGPLLDPNRYGETLPTEEICSTIRLGFRTSGAYHAEPPWGNDFLKGCPLSRDQQARAPLLEQSPAGDYLPFYYAIGALFYIADWSGSVEDRVHSVRTLSVLLGAFATLMTYLAGVAFFERRSLALAAATVFAMQPVASQQFSIVTNDALLFAVAAAFFWRYFVALNRGLVARDAVALGGLGGLAFVAKPQGGFLLGALGWLLAVHYLRDRDLLASVRQAIVAAGAAAVPIAIGLGIGYAARGRIAPAAAQPGAPASHSLRDYLHFFANNHFQHVYWMWGGTSWGLFAWSDIQLPSPLLGVIAALLVVATLGLAVAYATRRRRRDMILGGVVAVAVVTALLLAFAAYYFRLRGYDILAGRSFFFTMPAGAILWIAGLTALVPRRAERVAAGLVALAAVALNAFSLLVIWQAIYL